MGRQCLSVGLYAFTIFETKGIGMSWCNYDNCGYNVTINHQTVIQGDGNFAFEKRYKFGVCTNDEHCDDHDPCTTDFCDASNNICIYNQICSICNKELIKV